MAELLLLNPRRRRRASSSSKKRRSPRRRRNPINTIKYRPARRRSNPIGLRRARRVGGRRRRNPISLRGMTGTLMTQLRDAAIGAGGAIAVDVLMGKLNPMLPASMQRVPGQVGAGDAVKAVITVLLGKLLNKPTRGLASKAAQGALTVQLHGIASTFMPAGMALGYYSPAQTIPYSGRVGPLRSRGSMGRYVQPGVTPLLSGVGRYVRPGVTPLLSSAREREGSVR